MNLFGGYRGDASYYLCDCLWFYILGRHSFFLDLEEYDPEIGRTLNKIRTKECDSKKKMAKEQILAKQLKEYFTIATYDSPTSTCSARCYEAI